MAESSRISVKLQNAATGEFHRFQVEPTFEAVLAAVATTVADGDTARLTFVDADGDECVVSNDASLAAAVTDSGTPGLARLRLATTAKAADHDADEEAPTGKEMDSRRSDLLREIRSATAATGSAAISAVDRHARLLADIRAAASTIKAGNARNHRGNARPALPPPAPGMSFHRALMAEIVSHPTAAAVSAPAQLPGDLMSELQSRVQRRRAAVYVPCTNEATGCGSTTASAGNVADAVMSRPAVQAALASLATALAEAQPRIRSPVPAYRNISPTCTSCGHFCFDVRK